MQRILVTGSSGHLGEGLMRTLRERRIEAVGLDLLPGPHTHLVGSISDRDLVRSALDGMRHVLHTATLHKPHVATHSRQAFVDANVSGTLTLLEEAVRAGVESFVFTSTTSAFGHALVPPPGEPAAWITEEVPSVPKNIYGATKTAAEDLCRLIHQDHGLPSVVLRTSRFFPEEDDRPEISTAYDAENAKVNELLYRRVDLADAVEAHIAALERAPAIGFGRYIVSATTPFTRDELGRVREDAPRILAERYPQLLDLYESRGWRMFPSLERVYVNAKARAELGWRPVLDFETALDRLAAGRPVFSELSRVVGSKGYHRTSD